MLLWSAPLQAANALPVRKTGLVVNRGQLMVSIRLSDLFREADRGRMRSGFSTRVVIRIYLMKEGDDRPVGRLMRSSEIVYDLWDERFRVRQVDSRTGVPSELWLETDEQAIATATDLWQLPVLELDSLEPGRRYRLYFRADLNPVSEDMAKEVRRWLVRPPDGPRRLSPGETFFGSLVSIFVNPRIEESDRQLQFFSQTFHRPAP